MKKPPAWVNFLLTGIPFGAALGAYSKIDGKSTGFAMISGAITGLLFGPSSVAGRSRS
ncbi:hypothetical protein AB0P21_37610 [Kribbella sp. NPDC056861]|uniref:hypothetical protein n=1 Tax=Kribbella sp. NPDC056861 TaxID=3154857 RepID=UPI00342DA4B6